MTKRTVLLSLLAAGGALGGLPFVATSILPGTGPHEAVASTSPHRHPPAPAPPIAAVVQEILARPLFAADRRPLRVATPSNPQAASLDSARLLGTRLVGNVRVALFKFPNDARATVVGPGGSVTGMPVTEIGADRVIVDGSDGPETFVPVRDSENGPAASGPAASGDDDTSGDNND